MNQTEHDKYNKFSKYNGDTKSIYSNSRQKSSSYVPKAGPSKLTSKNLKAFSQNMNRMNASQMSYRSERSQYSQRSGKSIRSAYSSKSKQSQYSRGKEDRFAELYQVQNSQSRGRARPQSGKAENHRTLAIKKFEQLDNFMNDNINNLKNEVNKLKVEDYLTGSKSLRQLNLGANSTAKDMPIRVLDSLIENEERGNNGFSLYNRGQELK